MTAKIVQFPLAWPVAPPMPMNAAEEFFWREMVAWHEPPAALEQAYALAAAEALAFRAGVIFEWESARDASGADIFYTLNAWVPGGELGSSVLPAGEHGDNEMRLAEAQLALSLVTEILRYLDGDPDPEEQPMAEWERALLYAAA